jgi:hypothetical protein
MKLQKIALAFSVFALGVAMAASGHKVTVYDPVWVGATELKPGDYQVQVENGKAVFKNNKNSVEVPAKMETAKAKYPFTALNTDTSSGKAKLSEIQIGGTNMRIVIEPSSGSEATK